MTGEVTADSFLPGNMSPESPIHGKLKEKTLISGHISRDWTVKQSVFQRTKLYMTMLSECISADIIFRRVAILINGFDPLPNILTPKAFVLNSSSFSLYSLSLRNLFKWFIWCASSCENTYAIYHIATCPSDAHFIYLNFSFSIISAFVFFSSSSNSFLGFEEINGIIGIEYKTIFPSPL